MRTPPLRIEILLESNPPKSGLLVRRLAVQRRTCSASPKFQTLRLRTRHCPARSRFSLAWPCLAPQHGRYSLSSYREPAGLRISSQSKLTWGLLPSEANPHSAMRNLLQPIPCMSSPCSGWQIGCKSVNARAGAGWLVSARAMLATVALQES